MIKRVHQTLLLVSVLLTIFFSIIIYNSLQEKEENERWVIHTFEVIQKATTLLSELKDAETGQRGYLLTGRQEYLEPYKNALQNIDSELIELSKFTIDNTKQQENINALKYYIRKRIAVLDSTIKVYDKESLEGAQRVINTDSGRISMDSIRSIIDRMLSEEDKLLLIRSQKLKRSTDFLQFSTLLALAFIGLMTLSAYITISRKDKENNKLVSQLREYNMNLQSEVHNRTAELEEKNEELNRLNEGLIKLNAEKNYFLGMAAHDLKSPLNNVKGLIELLKTSTKNENNEQKEVLIHIDKSVTKMANLINDLLDINKIEQGASNMKIQSVNVTLLMRQVLEGFKKHASDKNIQLYYNKPLSDIFVESDKNYLVQIFDNLLSNAVKYTIPGKEVKVELTKSESEVKIAIIDQGMGIPPHELPELFGRFKKLSTRPTGGEHSSGLGLSIVKRLVDELGATIECSSEVGRGSVFTLALPVSAS